MPIMGFVPWPVIRRDCLQMSNNFTPVRDVEDAVPYKWGKVRHRIYNA